MAKKSIFIGSAQESKPVAMKIAQALTAAGYYPRRWWEDFPAGSITIDRLLEIAQKVDGAVLLFTATDKTWYRKEWTQSPRDNVILEYGLFLANLDRHRTMILAEQNARLPSDIQAITYERLLDDSSGASERVVEHFNRVFRSAPQNPEGISLIVDPAAVDHVSRQSFPAAWHERLLYPGLEGARGWLALSSEPNYIPQQEVQQFQQLVREALKNIEPRTVVSLGPGDAKTDLAICLALREKEPWLQYIPVDISDGLLYGSVKILRDHVRVRVGVLGDFEDSWDFIHRQVQRNGAPPFLYVLLGNTLANLDGFEASFLTNVRQSLTNREDRLLLDLTLAGADWAFDTDYRTNHASYSAAFRRWLSVGVGRRTNESADAVLQDFESRISFQRGPSDVPLTRTINIVDKRAGVLVAIRRYDWNSLISWLNDEMHLEVEYSSSFFMDGLLGHGVIVASRRPLTGRATST